jgi:hypothetical protein
MHSAPRTAEQEQQLAAPTHAATWEKQIRRATLN